MCKAYPYRVFISYAHEDRDLAELLAKAAEGMMLVPLWDRGINPGMPFTDAIKSSIAHSHVFMPLITESSSKRPWVHQETGYALALNIPVLPVAVGSLPQEMVAQLHAVVVKADLSDASERLAEVNFEQLVSPSAAQPVPMVEVAEWPEDRTRLMAHCAAHVVEMGAYGVLRQRGALSSFCLPDADLGDEIWRRREGKLPRSQYLHQLQRQERKALEAHARAEGCRLIIDPSIELGVIGPRARRARLETLRDALSSMHADGVDLMVVTSPVARHGNLTIVGDWFVAESQVPRPGEGYRQTVFNWHTPTVLGCVRRFDEQFECLCSGQTNRSGRVVGPDVEAVMEHLDGIIGVLPDDPAPPCESDHCEDEQTPDAPAPSQ